MAESSRIIAAGVSWWNRAAVRALIAADGAAPVFVPTVRAGLAAVRRPGDRLWVWASRPTAAEQAEIAAASVHAHFIEDGFLRSVGLGAGLARGGAYVVDRRGIYYDARRPSDIEAMLETATVEAAERERARRLVDQIVAARVSKYNVGRRGQPLSLPSGRQRVLVVGQVAGDAGVRLTLSETIDVGRPETVNRDLLRAARSEFPQAAIIYKPHPDVATGLRAGAVASEELARLADVVAVDADIVDLIAAVDRVVTISSLSGFEAILRGKPVTVHGLPFYAGWGLTDDHTRSPRRTRRLNRDTLAAIALLRYSRYVDPVRVRPVEPEEMVAALERQRLDPMHRLLATARRQVSWAGRKLGL